MNKLIVSILLFFIGATANAQTEVPNDFQAGTPARAAEVNENFNTLETAIDDNAANVAINTADITANTANAAVNTSSIQTNAANISNNADAIDAVALSSGLQIYSQGVSIGNFVEFLQSGIEPYYYMRVVSHKGYLFKVTSYLDSTVSDPEFAYLPRGIIYFSDPGCTGTAKVPTNLSTAALGTVFKGWGPTPNSVYYIPRGSTQISGAYQSIWKQSPSQPQFGECDNESSSRPVMVAVLPNDEEITGVSNFAPIQPVSLGVP